MLKQFSIVPTKSRAIFVSKYTSVPLEVLSGGVSTLGLVWLLSATPSPSAPWKKKGLKRLGWLLAGDVEIRTTQLCIQVICIGGIGISFIRVIFLFGQNYEWCMQYWIRSISTCRQDSWCIGVSFDGFHFILEIFVPFVSVN